MDGSRNEVVVFNLQTEYECLKDYTVIHLYVFSQTNFTFMTFISPVSLPKIRLDSGTSEGTES